MAARLLPGEGAIPLVDWIRLLDDIGSQAPIGVEIYSSVLAAQSPHDVATRVGAATRQLFRVEPFPPASLVPWVPHRPWQLRSSAALFTSVRGGPCNAP